MRQNRATSAPFFYCVSYEILCETRIKPGFFGNCLISLSSALGAQCLGSQFAGVAPQAIRALGSWSLVGTVQDRPSRQARRSLPLVLIKRIAHVRGGGGLPSPPSFGGHLPQRGRRDLAFCKPLVSCLLGSPFGGAGTAAAVTERASCQPHRPLPWLSPLRARPPRSLVSLWLAPTKGKGKVAPFLKKRRPKKLYVRCRSAAPLTGCSLR